MNAVDTNVLVYAVDSTERDKSVIASNLLKHLMTIQEPLVIPWQVAAEFLTTLRKWEDARRIRRDDTLTHLTRFISTLPIAYPTVRSLSIALELSDRHSLSHWDSMILAACIEASVNTLYSEDFSHEALYGTVRVLNPFV
jgi:predicted nucleic acid-binding protein